MRTVTFLSVLQGIAWRQGINPALDVTTDQVGEWTSFVNTRLPEVWDAADWPEWTIYEERTPSSHVVPFEEASKTDMGRVLGVYLRDPRGARGVFDTPFRLDAGGVHVGFDHGTTVWVKFLLRPPQFTSTPWSSATTYALGDLAYDAATGESYKSLQAGNANHAVTDDTWWEKVDFPYILQQPVIRLAYSDALRDEGETEAAAREEQAAYAELVRRAGGVFGIETLTDQERPELRWRGEKAA